MGNFCLRLEGFSGTLPPQPPTSIVRLLALPLTSQSIGHKSNQAGFKTNFEWNNLHFHAIHSFPQDFRQVGLPIPKKRTGNPNTCKISRENAHSLLKISYRLVSPPVHSPVQSSPSTPVHHGRLECHARGKTRCPGGEQGFLFGYSTLTHTRLLSLMFYI